MKLKKKVFDIFNLSFLDIISCGFGAVVLLVLISKTAEDTSQSTVGDVKNLLSLVITLENSIEKVSITPATSNTTRDEEVGGIPPWTATMLFSSWTLQAVCFRYGVVSPGKYSMS